MNATPVFLEIAGPVGTITLAREARRNSLDLYTVGCLHQLVWSVAEREDLRVLVIKGEGEVFCSGIDMDFVSQAQAMADVDSFRQLLKLGKGLSLLFRRMPQLVVASVNGSATGAGLGLVLAADWVVASDQACFGETSAWDGLFPSWTNYWRLQNRLGPGKALELVMLGQVLSAEEALRHGIVNQVVVGENLRECAARVAAKLAEGPPLVVREIKRISCDGNLRQSEERSDLEIESQVKCFLSEDSRAGVQAVLRKKRAKFEGR